MSENKLYIPEENFKKAIERHERAWEKELEEVDIRAVVLKTKKAVLEQAMINARVQNAQADQQYEMRDIKRQLERYSNDMEELFELVAEMKLTFKNAIEIMAKHQEEEQRKKEEKRGFFSNFWDFLKCLMR